jgi:hypothetical protein
MITKMSLIKNIKKDIKEILLTAGMIGALAYPGINAYANGELPLRQQKEAQELKQLYTANAKDKKIIYKGSIKKIEELLKHYSDLTGFAGTPDDVKGDDTDRALSRFHFAYDATAKKEKKDKKEVKETKAAEQKAEIKLSDYQRAVGEFENFDSYFKNIDDGIKTEEQKLNEMQLRKQNELKRHYNNLIEVDSKLLNETEKKLRERLGIKEEAKGEKPAQKLEDRVSLFEVGASVKYSPLYNNAIIYNVEPSIHIGLPLVKRIGLGFGYGALSKTAEISKSIPGANGFSGYGTSKTTTKDNLYDAYLKISTGFPSEDLSLNLIGGFAFTEENESKEVTEQVERNGKILAKKTNSYTSNSNKREMLYGADLDIGLPFILKGLKLNIGAEIGRDNKLVYRTGVSKGF